jgi:hypothetical protein
MSTPTAYQISVLGSRGKTHLPAVIPPHLDFMVAVLLAQLLPLCPYPDTGKLDPFRGLERQTRHALHGRRSPAAGLYQLILGDPEKSV